MNSSFESLVINRLTAGDHVTLALSGEIDIATVGRVDQAVGEAVAVARSGVTLDLSGVTFIDAAGLGALVRGRRRSAHLRAGLTLSAVTPRTSRLLSITGLDQHLTIVDGAVRAGEGRAEAI